MFASLHPLSRPFMGPVKKFEIANVRDREKKSKILVFHRFKNGVKLMYCIQWTEAHVKLGIHYNPIPLHIVMSSLL